MSKLYVKRDTLTDSYDGVYIDGQYKEYLHNFSRKAINRFRRDYNCELEEVQKLPE